ncbi:MAG: helix-turn-helix domain-containing protein [Mycobacterium sp.]
MATSPATADRVGKELRIRYESGESIRQVADETGYGITRVRGLLERAGTTFGGRGR